MRTWWILSLAALLLAGAGCKDKKQTEARQNAPTTQTAQPEPPRQEPPKETAPAPTPTAKAEPHYFLIAGCFEYRSNADNLAESLKASGFPDAEVLPYYENLYLVSYCGYATREEAEEALRKMRQEDDRADTWLHHAK